MHISQNYYNDYAYLKKIGNSYKLIKCNQVKRKGLESVDIIHEYDSFVRRNGIYFEVYNFEKQLVNYSSENSCNSSFHEHTNDEKLRNNICRARNKILEYVLCNDFVYFVTITLKPELFDRTNLGEFIKKLGKFINNYNNRKDAEIKYLLIPEQHEDGCWHMHGFIMGLPVDRLIQYDIHTEKKLPMYIVNKVKAGDVLYYFPEFEDKFGFNIFEPIRSKKASVLYMSKYLTKDASRNVTELGAHLYYCSKGLKKAEIIKQGQFLDCEFEFDYQNEYGAQSFYDELDDVQLEAIKEKIGGDPLTIDDFRRGYIKKDGWYNYCDKDTGEIIGNYPDELIS